MIPVQGVSGKKVVVLGLGRSGLATAHALIAGGAQVICWDDTPATRATAQDQGLHCADPTRQGFDGIDLLITSPGIAHLYPAPQPIIAAAMDAGVPVDNDISLFFKSFATRDWDNFDTIPRVIAVTGSNGKSTTSALIHHVLQAAGRPTQLGGNIGRGALDLAPPQDGEVVVLELSSYQTELARNLTPDVGVFINLSPDHLDRHNGMGGYFAAKARLFTAGRPDRAVIGMDEIEGRMLANTLSEGPGDDQVIGISTTSKLAGFHWTVTARKGFLAETRKGRQVAAIDLRDIAGLPGQHNHQNACAAYAALRSLNIAPKVIEQGLRSFGGLAHRSQQVAQVNDVIFVNDSKATNVDAALQSLRAYKNIRWICGGQQKQGGLDGLNAAWETVEKAYVIGETAAEFAAQLNVPTQVCGTMATAVQAAFADAKPGDVILLAPAAASRDQYSSFEARGDDFTQLALQILASA